MEPMSNPLCYVADAEPWASYTLEDGTRLRVKVVLVKVFRVGVDDAGGPKYECQFQQILDVTPSWRLEDAMGIAQLEYNATRVVS
jgi:hypothetical protein